MPRVRAIEFGLFFFFFSPRFAFWWAGTTSHTWEATLQPGPGDAGQPRRGLRGEPRMLAHASPRPCPIAADQPREKAPESRFPPCRHQTRAAAPTRGGAAPGPAPRGRTATAGTRLAPHAAARGGPAALRAPGPSSSGPPPARPRRSRPTPAALERRRPPHRPRVPVPPWPRRPRCGCASRCSRCCCSPRPPRSSRRRREVSGGDRAGLGWGLRECRGPVPGVPRGGGYGHGRLREALGGCAWERRGCCLRPVPLPKAKRDRRELEAPGREAGVWLARGYRGPR